MLVSFAVTKAACSGFSNLEYSLIWLIYIHKHIRGKVNQYLFNSKVQHSQKIPTSSKRQSKNKNKKTPNSLFSNLSHLYAALTKGHESCTKVILNETLLLYYSHFLVTSFH